MSKVFLKMDGNTVGVCESFKINESSDDIGQCVQVYGTASRIKFDRIDLFKPFNDSVYDNKIIDFEFETDDSIWKIYGAYINEYEYHPTTDNPNIFIVDYMEFNCESVVKTEGTMTKKEPEQLDTFSPEYQEMINKFTAAISKVTWIPVEDECPSCNAKTLERSRGLMYGPWSGTIRCTSCDFKDSFTSYVGKKSITVEPLK